MTGPLEAWRDFYVMVGGASAALTGLLFVAMSLHLRSIATSPTERGRARATLTGLVWILLVSALGLIPGLGLRTFGFAIGAAAIALLAQSFFVIRGLAAHARRHPAQAVPGWRARSAVYVAFHMLGLTTSVLLIEELDAAPYAVAAIVSLGMVIMVVNTWTMLLDISEHEDDRSRG